jgi:peptide/nickel transport system substrate-binding protein
MFGGRHASRWAAGAVACGLALVGAACSGGGGSAAPSGAARPGGQAVIGAEQWPQCLNPITSCTYSAWYFYTVGYQVLPHAMELSPDGAFRASPLLTRAPTAANGDLSDDPFTVTFHLNPEARWNDGTPITAEDFDFTYRAILNTVGTVSTTGYDKIKSIDTRDPRTVRITFTEPVVDWADVFGGSGGFVLEKAAFPDADPDKPDLSKEMLDSIPFSGGPWVLQSWDKQQEVLVRNDRYWGDRALLDRVSFVRRQNQTTEINSLKTGEVDAIFPEPTNVSLLDQFAGSPAIRTVGGGSPYWEAIHLNNRAPPLDDSTVREALLYAINRQAVVDSLVRLNDPEAQVLNCLGWLPTIGSWCDDTDFASFTYQPQRSIQLLESDGYDCSKVPDAPCEKNGAALTLEYVTTSGDDRRADTQALLKEAAKPAGFELQTKVEDPTFLFSNVLIKGDYQMTDFALGGSPDPSVTSLWSCDSIPTQQNGYAGQNTDFWCNNKASALMEQSDRETDPAARLRDIHAVGDLQVQDRMGLPMYVLPDVTAWRADKIGGDIGAYNESIYGPFFNLNTWYAVSPAS